MQAIKTACGALLASRCAAGIDVLESMSKHEAGAARIVWRHEQCRDVELLTVLQEVAFQRLNAWVQQKYSPGDVAELAPRDVLLLTSALRALRERPAFFRHCQDTIAASRRTGIARRCASPRPRLGGLRACNVRLPPARRARARRFVTALTRGSSAGVGARGVAHDEDGRRAGAACVRARVRVVVGGGVSECTALCVRACVRAVVGGWVGGCAPMCVRACKWV